MKNKLMLPLAVALSAGAAIAATSSSPLQLISFRQAKPVEIKTPQLGDSASRADFKPSKLLQYAWKGDFTTVAQGTTATDKDGWLQLPATSESSASTISGLKTNLRATRYAKGKLAVTSPLPFEVTANGKKLGIKETLEDSVSDASTKKFDMELQPEMNYEIIIRTLSPAGSDAGVSRLKAEFVPDEKFEDVAVIADPAMKKRFSIATTVEGPRVLKATISPDGKYLLTQYSEQFENKKVRRWAELTETASGRLIHAEENADAEWMPTRNALRLTVPQGDAYALYSIEIPSMKRTLLADNIPVEIFSISPDESYIIYNEEIKGTVEEGPLKRITSPDDRMPGNRDRLYLMKYSLADKTAQPLTAGGATCNLLDISPDSREVLYMTVRETPSKFPFYANTLIRQNVATLATDTVVADDPTLAGAIFSPDGKRLFAWGGPTSLGSIGANQGAEHPMPNDFDTQGFIIDLKDNSVDPVTKDFNPALLGVPVWNRTNGKIYFRAYDEFTTPVYEFDPAARKFRRLPVEVDKVLTFSIGDKESRWMTYTGQCYDRAGALYLMDLRNGKSTTVANPLGPTLDNINWGEMQSWKFKASDGTTIDGNLILPPDFDATRKYPLIVYYYGGTLPSDKSMGTPYTPQLFASRDYVVYVLNPSGAIGYGQEFSARHVNAWGKRTAEDIMEGIKELCKTHSFIDDRKIGCLGASYGGFMTQYLLTRTDMFAAAVSHAGISNVTSYWGEGYWGYSYNAVAAAKSYPWTDPELFTRQGSLFNADKIHTPLLLLHGTADTNVPIGESIQLFNALKILGRDVEFITVEDQNHVILDYDKRVLWHATIMAWFAKWLQDDSRWWDSMYGK